MQQISGFTRALPLALGGYKRELMWIVAGLLLALPLGYAAKLRLDAAEQLRQGVILSASGTLTVERVQVMAEVLGVVREVPEKGAYITAGQPLARVENLDLEAAVVMARSQLNVARAGLAKVQAPARAEDLDDLDTAIKLATVALEAAQRATDSLHAGINAAAAPRQSAQAALTQELKAIQAKAGQADVSHHAPADSGGTALSSGGHGTTPPGSGGAAEDDCEVHQQLRELTRLFETAIVQVAAADQAVSAARDTSLMEQLMAQVEIARINLEQAKARKARASAPPRSEDAAEAHSRVEQAQVALTLAEQRLSKATLVAPVSGVVLDVPVTRGRPVNVGQPLVILSHEANTYVTLRVRNKAAEAVVTGQPAMVTVNGTSVDGWVTAVTREADGAWTTIKVAVDTQDLWLTGGTAAQVKILADEPAD